MEQSFQIAGISEKVCVGGLKFSRTYTNARAYYDIYAYGIYLKKRNQTSLQSLLKDCRISLVLPIQAKQ